MQTQRLLFFVLWVFVFFLGMCAGFGCGDDDDDSGSGGESVCEQFCEIIAACPSVAEALGITSMDQCLEYCNGIDNETGNCVLNAASCDEVTACFKTTDDDDDDSSDDDDDDTEPDCTDNHPPILNTPMFFYNLSGSFGDLIYMPAIIYRGVDEIGFSTRYEDEDCNLVGGYIHVKMDDESWVTIDDPIPDLVSCGYSYSGVFKIITREDADSGPHTIHMYYTDVCDSQSNEVIFDFTVVDPPEVGGSELLVNGDFEAGDMDWEHHSLLGNQRIYRMSSNQLLYYPSNGEWASLIGGYMNGHDILRQEVSVPESVQSIRLQAIVLGQTTDFDGEGGDYMDIYLTDGIGKQKALLKRIYDFECFDFYGLVRAEISGTEAEVFSGTDVHLVFEFFSDGDCHSTYFQVDEVSLQAWTVGESAGNPEIPSVHHEEKGSLYTQGNFLSFYGGIRSSHILPSLPHARKNGCEGNQPPSMWVHEILVENELIEPPVFAYPNDLISFILHWSDPECDIYGGSIYWSPHLPYYFWMEVIRKLFDVDDYGCGTEFEPHIYFTTNFRSNYLLQLEIFHALQDPCGAFSTPASHSVLMILDPIDDTRDNAIINGGFEDGFTGWSTTSPDATIVEDAGVSRVGSKCAVISGEQSATTMIQQSGELPNGYSMAALAFWLKIESDDPEMTPTDELIVSIDSIPEPMAAFTNSSAAELGDNWHYFYYDVSGFIDNDISVEFSATFANDHETFFYLDEVSLRYD